MSFTPRTWINGETLDATKLIDLESRISAGIGSAGSAGSIIDAYRDYGVRADGTDNATRLQNFLNACRDSGPGAKGILPPGTILSASTLYFDSNVALEGVGEGTILKQANSSNLAVFIDSRSRASLTGTTGAGSAAGETRFKIKNMLLDGNKQNNTSVATDGLKIYGYRYGIEDLGIRNFKGRPITTEWAPIADSGSSPVEPGHISGEPMECFINRLRIYNNDRGMLYNGPNDSVISHLFACNNAFAPQAGGPNPPTDPQFLNSLKGVGLLMDRCHIWNGGNYSYQFDEGVLCQGCIAEGGWYANVGVHATGVSWLGGNIFAASSMIYSNKVGVHIGPTGYSLIMRGVTMSECSGGYFDFRDGDGGSPDIEAWIYSYADAPLYLGSPGSGARWNLAGSINGDHISNFLPPARRTALHSDTRDDYGALSDEDDFIQNVTTSGSIGKLGWTKFLTSTGAVGTIPSALWHPGILRLTTGATSGSLASIGLSATTDGCFTSDSEQNQVFVFQANNVDANTTIRIGMQADASANPSTDGVYMEKLAADTHWFFVCRAGGTQTRVDSGVTAVTGWNKLRIHWQYGSAVFYGFYLGTTTRVPTNVTTNIPANSLALTPVFQIANTAAAAKTLDVDYYGFRVLGLNR